MLSRRQRTIILIAAAAILFAIVISNVFPYKDYCQQGAQTNKYYCASDDVLASLGTLVKTYSDVITAIATAVIGLFTLTIYNVSRTELDHARQVERAYVSGVVDIDWHDEGTIVIESIRIPQKYPVSVTVTISNHGKTPAFIHDIAFDKCAPDDVPVIPVYAKRVADLMLSPETVGWRTQYRFPFDKASGQVIYGRIYYTDIFRAPHSTGFIVQVDGQAVIAWRGERREYTDWD